MRMGVGQGVGSVQYMGGLLPTAAASRVGTHNCMPTLQFIVISFLKRGCGGREEGCGYIIMQ